MTDKEDEKNKNNKDKKEKNKDSSKEKDNVNLFVRRSFSEHLYDWLVDSCRFV